MHGSDDIFEGAIRKQVVSALEEASVVLFMVDVAEGLHDMDKDFANVLRTINKPIFIVANKADNSQRTFLTGEFYKLGFENILPVSSINGSGTGELLDMITENFEDDYEDPEEGLPKIAIMGRPNVGKSSFLNVLLGAERSIVTEIAGTTRDAINTRYNLFGKDLILIDTAGRSPRDSVRIDELNEFLGQGSEVENCLVLAAPTEERQQQQILKAFSKLPLTRLIITKLDETDRCGALINLPTRSNLPLAYLTNGQQVPEDLLLAEPGSVAELVMTNNTDSRRMAV